MQGRFSAVSGSQEDVDKLTGVIYVKSGYCKGERESPRRRGQSVVPRVRGQGGGQCVHPGGTVIAPDLTRRQGVGAPPSISIQLAMSP
jgi:hypothetical protein